MPLPNEMQYSSGLLTDLHLLLNPAQRIHMCEMCELPVAFRVCVCVCVCECESERKREWVWVCVERVLDLAFGS